MGTIIGRKHTSRSELGPYKRHELLFGEILYPLSGYTGYGAIRPWHSGRAAVGRRGAGHKQDTTTRAKY